MTFEVDVNGRTRTVSIERTAPGKYRVLLDGDPHDVDAARVGVYGLSMLVDGERGVSREVQVTPAGAPGSQLITLGGHTIEAMVNGRRTGRAAVDGGVALSENLTGQVFVNQTAAFSDFHGTGANPAANAAYTDAAFVANRFRVITSRRHI